MEEHAYDFRGWRYAFVPGFNHGVGALLFKECEKLGHLRCPLEPRLTTEVNVGGIWIGFSLCMIAAECLRGPYSYAGLVNWGMCMVNAFAGHLLPWLFMGYNPGAVQSVFMFACGAWFLYRCPGTLRFAASAILNGIILHVITFGLGMNLVLKLQWPPEVVGLLSVICTTLIPLRLAHLAAPQKREDWRSGRLMMKALPKSRLPFLCQILDSEVIGFSLAGFGHKSAHLPYNDTIDWKPASWAQWLMCLYFWDIYIYIHRIHSNAQ